MIYKDVINIINRLLWEYHYRQNINEYRMDYKLTTRFVGMSSLLEYKGLPAVQWRHSKYGSWRNIYNFIENKLLECRLPMKY